MELTLIENTAHRPTIHLDFKHPCSPVTHPHVAASQRGLGKKDGGKNGKTLYLRNYFHSSLGHKAHLHSALFESDQGLTYLFKPDPRGRANRRKALLQGSVHMSCFFQIHPKTWDLPSLPHTPAPGTSQLRKTVSNHTTFYVKPKSFSFHLPLNNK